MKIEVLHVVDCPSWLAVSDRLQVALRANGLEKVVIEHRLLRSAEDAAQVLFGGSPTILVDGEDLFPGAARTTELACRVYQTPAGLAGLPTTEQLTNEIRARGR